MPGHRIFPSIAPDRDDDQDDADPARELADSNYQTVVASVTAGDVDGVLDRLEELDDRESVREAIGKRRDELESTSESEG